MDQLMSSLKQLAIPDPMADELSWLKPTYNSSYDECEEAAMSDWSADIKPMIQDGDVLTCTDMEAIVGFIPMRPLVHPKPLTSEFIIIVDVLSLPEFCSITLGLYMKREAEWKDIFEMRGKGRYFLFKKAGKSECNVIDVSGRIAKSYPCDINSELHPFLYFGRKEWSWRKDIAKGRENELVKVSIKIGNATP